MSTVAQIVTHTLKELGVRYVFGVPSGNMIDYIEALRQENNIDFVLVAHETTAAIMADVCGRITGIPGVCFGTFGPGATNLATGVGEAFLDRSPLIAFTDEMPDNLLKRIVQMNINHQQLFFPITKKTMRMGSQNVREIILKAAGVACADIPGSVHIGIPSGIGQQEYQETQAKIDYLRIEKKRWSPLIPEQFGKVKHLWAKSKKPILAVGLSAVRADVKNEILDISEKFEIPVVLTPMAKGMFPENHPLYAGVLFHALANLVAETYLNADLVIGVGYDSVEINYENWMPGVPLIHLGNRKADVDTIRIPEVLNVTGNLKNALNELLNTNKTTSDWDVDKIQKQKKRLFDKLSPKSNKFGPVAVISNLRKVLPQDGILTVDVGAHLHLIGQMWQTPSPEKLLITNGWSGMGFAIPAAMAAKLCNPQLPVAALLGDGGFLMTVGELATAKRLNLNIVFVVMYDNSLSLIRIKQNKMNYDNQYGTCLDILSETPTNHYFGVPVIRVFSEEEYDEALERGFSAPGPIVIEAVVDGNDYDELVLK